MVAPEQKARNVGALEAVVKLAAFSDAPIQPLPGWLSLAPIQPVGGNWYFSFECPACRRASPIFRDFSDGNLGSPFRRHGIEATCLFCRANVVCPSENIGPIEWPLAPGQAPVRSEYANRVARKYNDDPEYRPIFGPLHHYTSLDAFLSIVKSKVLWATNIRYLNDSSESELGLKLMKQVAEEALTNAAGVDAEILAYLVKWLANPKVGTASVYVLSFSEAHDQLNQWRGYTTYGQGGMPFDRLSTASTTDAVTGMDFSALPVQSHFTTCLGGIDSLSDSQAGGYQFRRPQGGPRGRLPGAY